MITKDQLQGWRQEATKKFLTEIEDKIIAQNEKGHTSTTYHLPVTYPHLEIEFIIKTLHDAGFNVDHSQGQDYRNDAWNYIDIGWE